MKNKALWCAALTLPGLAALVLGLWLVAVPEETMLGAIYRSVGPGIEIRFNGFKKGLFYSVSADSVSITRSDMEIIEVTNVSARLKPLHLFLLKAVVSFEGTLAGGKLTGRAEVDRQRVVHLTVTGADVSKLSALEALGIRGRGKLEISARMQGIYAEARLSIKEAEFEPFEIFGVPAPLNMFHTVRAALSFTGETLAINSLTLEGDDIFTRVKGSLRGRELVASAEIMPEPGSAISKLLGPLLERYKVSPGYYVVPLNTMLDL